MSLTIDSCGGMCPTQAEGKFYNNPFYFRARHGHWTLWVSAPKTDPISGDLIFHQEGIDPSNGCMNDQAVKTILEKCFKEFEQKCPQIK